MRFVWREGLGVIEAHKAPRLPPKRSHLSAPYIRADGMDVTWNPATGQLYDSKSAYEKAVRAAGCEIVGNDRAFSDAGPREISDTTSERELKQDIKDAIDQLGGV